MFHSLFAGKGKGTVVPLSDGGEGAGPTEEADVNNPPRYTVADISNIFSFRITFTPRYAEERFPYRSLRYS